MNKKIHAVYIGYLLILLISSGLPSVESFVREFGMLAIAVFPAVLIIQRRLTENRFWVAIAAAHVFWGFGQVVWIASRHNLFSTLALQDSAYWIFKLLILGAVLYRPFNAATDVHRRVHVIDTAVALSVLAFYVGYFFIGPNVVGEDVAPAFYGTASGVLLNAGIALTIIVVAWKARLSGWKNSYKYIALGMSAYAVASLWFVASQTASADPFWCLTFWALALAASAAPARDIKPLDEVLVPSRYGLALMLITTVAGVHIAVSLVGGSSHELYDLRTMLTFAEVVALTALIHFRQKIVIDESELRQQQLEVTLNALRQPIYIVDGNYNVTLANDVFRSRFGEGGVCHSLIFGRSKPCEWCQLSQRKEFSTLAEHEGSAYQIEFAPFASGGVELLVDVTSERKRQQQTVQTERMAALGRMIAGTAHELNNPLAIILGNAHLLRDYHSLDKDGRRQVTAISSAAERARDIVHTFLSLSRPIDGEKALVDLASVIRSVEHLKASELRTYGIALDLDLPESMTMLGKYTLLQEIFLNLIDNASDAIRETGRKSGLIVIHGEVAPGDRLRIQLSDNGAGIARDHLNRIFDPFFSTKDVGKGTGLGLSVVHSIVTDHGGKINVDSDGASFTRFDIEFAQVRVSPAARKLKERRPSVLRILAVDDEPAILNILERCLSRLGHHVEVTTTGNRALQLLSKNKFDVMLLDMHLPEMDGKSLMMRVNALVPPVNVRTIIITGDTMSEDTRRFAQDYSLPLLMKPIDMDRLTELLEGSVLPHS